MQMTYNFLNSLNKENIMALLNRLSYQNFITQGLVHIEPLTLLAPLEVVILFRSCNLSFRIPVELSII